MNLAGAARSTRASLLRTWWLPLVLGVLVPVLMLLVDRTLFGGASLERVRELGGEPLPIRLGIAVYSGAKWVDSSAFIPRPHRRPCESSMLRAAACLLLGALVTPGVAPAAQEGLLLNPSFETGLRLPDGWTLAGDGSFRFSGADPHDGSRAAALAAPPNGYVLLFQRLAAEPGDRFTLGAWYRLAGSAGTAELKLEFHDAGEAKLDEQVRPLVAPADWGRFFVVGEAPPGTALVTATVVATGGARVEVDDLLLTAPPPPSEIAFDLTDTGGEILGFGAQVWAHAAPPAWPDLQTIREAALADLGIGYVRVEVVQEGHTFDELRALRAATDALGIEWVAMAWSAPESFVDGAGKLSDERGFADWWARRVAELAAEGIPVEWVEVMNEPDSGGAWSTGIDPQRYDRLVRFLRRRLDRLGLTGVGIVGPGLSSTSWSGPEGYLAALTPGGLASLAAFSTHTWADDFLGAYPEGGVSTAGYWANFGEHAAARDASLPRFVTEYASKQDTFHGVSYRTPDDSPWDDVLVFPYHNVTNTMPYAARVFQQTLALAGSQNGPTVAILWQLVDEPTEVLDQGKGWGLVDLWGKDKPVAGALRTLLPAVPPGSRVVRPPDQAFAPLYAGAFVDGDRVVIGIANSSPAEESAMLRLSGVAEGLVVAYAVSFEPLFYGDPESGEPDVGQRVDLALELLAGEPGEASLEVTLPGDATLTVVLQVAGDGESGPAG